MSTKLNMVKVIDLDGPLGVAALGRSLDRLIARHAVLRTTYRLSGAEVVQVVLPPLPATMRLVDLRAKRVSERADLNGCFIMTLPIRSEVAQGSSMRDRVRVEGDATLGAFDGREVPCESAVGELNPMRLPARNPYCDLILNFTETGRTSFDFGPVRAERRLNQNIGTGTFDASVKRSEDQLHAIMTVDPSWAMLPKPSVWRLRSCDSRDRLHERKLPDRRHF